MVVYTYCPLDVWTSSVINVEVAGHIQFRASIAYLNSSSHTTWSVGGKKDKKCFPLNTIINSCPCIGKCWRQDKNLPSDIQHPLAPGGVQDVKMICPIYAVSQIVWLKLILHPVSTFTTAMHGENAIALWICCSAILLHWSYE